MPSLLTVALSLILNSAPPFPAPKMVPYTDQLKCDTAAIARVTASELVLNTPAGVVVFKLAPETKLIGADGQPTAAASLHAGQMVRVYYVLSDAARVSEVDVLQ